jgi:hypothetical protein
VVDGDGAARATVLLDSAPMPAALVGVASPVDPGQHRLQAKSGSAASSEVIVSIPEGTARAVTLTLKPAAEAPESPAGAAEAAPTRPQPEGESSPRGMNLGTWIAFGVGAAGAIAGTAFLVKNRVDRGDADALCPGGPCAASKRSEIDSLDGSANTSATLSWVGYGVAVAGVGTGLLLLLLQPRKPERVPTAGVQLWIGASAAGVRGGF